MPPASSAIRVVVVEDHMLVREGLIAILETYPDIEVVGSAGDSSGALAAVAEQQPDTLLLDVKIPGDDVTVTVTRVQKISPRTRIVILSMYDGPELVRKLLDLGVDGYLLKNATRHQLVAAIRGVHSDDGGIVLFVSRQSLAQLQDGGPAVLTPRERDVLELVARAMSNAQVAAKLYLTEATVKRHLRNAFVKLGAVSRIDAVNKATAAAQISPRPENVGVVEALPASSVAGHHRPIREQPYPGHRPA